MAITYKWNDQANTAVRILDGGSLVQTVPVSHRIYEEEIVGNPIEVFETPLEEAARLAQEAEALKRARQSAFFNYLDSVGCHSLMQGLLMGIKVYRTNQILVIGAKAQAWLNFLDLLKAELALRIASVSTDLDFSSVAIPPVDDFDDVFTEEFP